MTRLPTLFLPHGGGPWPFVDLGFGTSGEVEGLRGWLASVAHIPAQAPRALLVLSAHWEEDHSTLMTAPKPDLLFDYYGFPPAAYQLTWPAPGAPELVERVSDLLRAGGFGVGLDATRGFDHGTFVPLKVAYPTPTIPTLQLSLKRGLDPAEHLALGRALAPLRDEGVFILGSGSSFHNLRAFNHPDAPRLSAAFDAWLCAATLAPRAEREAALLRWAEAPAARFCHPREEHLIPLLVCAGAGLDDAGSVPYARPFFGVATSAHQFG